MGLFVGVDGAPCGFLAVDVSACRLDVVLVPLDVAGGVGADAEPAAGRELVAGPDASWWLLPHAETSASDTTTIATEILRGARASMLSTLSASGRARYLHRARRVRVSEVACISSSVHGPRLRGTGLRQDERTECPFTLVSATPANTGIAQVEG